MNLEKLQLISRNTFTLVALFLAMVGIKTGGDMLFPNSPWISWLAIIYFVVSVSKDIRKITS